MPEAVPLRMGRYELHGVIGAGGMATVHFGRLDGPGGFTRVVAVKRLLPHVAQEVELAGRFLDEARLVARIRHANVVQTLDVVLDGSEALVIMEYVPGEALGKLLQQACRGDDPPPPAVVSAIMAGALEGLHAAHVATSDVGEPLGIVHRDVSPQNILVGTDGVARLLDFGVAKATAFTAITPGGQIKGKVAYMAPEQLRQREVTLRSDVFSASVVLWESLVARRLFLDETEARTVGNVLSAPIQPPSAFVPSLPRALDDVVLRGLERDPRRRFSSAREMALALQRALAPASRERVADWVYEHARDAIARREALLQEVEAPRPSRPSTFVALSPPPAKRGSLLASGERRRLELRAPRVRPQHAAIAMGAAGVVLAAVLAWSARRTAASSSSAGVPEPLTVASAPEPRPVDSVAVPAGTETASPATPRAERVVRTRAQGAATRPASTGGTCSPPFTYNSSGHKVFKPQCL